MKVSEALKEIIEKSKANSSNDEENNLEKAEQDQPENNE